MGMPGNLPAPDDMVLELFRVRWGMPSRHLPAIYGLSRDQTMYNGRQKQILSEITHLVGLDPAPHVGLVSTPI
jgi:hypothetical protein